MISPNGKASKLRFDSGKALCDMGNKAFAFDQVTAGDQDVRFRAGELVKNSECGVFVSVYVEIRD
jgi:hypothetical protein